MEMRRIRHFLAVAEHGTLTAAAAYLGIAQPAVSQSITKLETEVGARLFRRTRKGAELTSAGVAFREDILDGFGLIQSAMERARERAKGKAGRLTVGAVTGALYIQLPQAMALMRQHFPRIELVIKEMGNLEQAEALRANTIDVGFMHPPFPSSSWLREKVLQEDRLIAAVPRDFPAPHNGEVSFRTLCPYNLITIHEELMPSLRADLQTAYKREGYPLRIGQEVSHTMTVLSCVSSGTGIALLPSQVRNIAFRDVRYLEIKDGELLPRSITSVVWRAGGKTTIADQFVQLLSDGR